MRKLLFTLSVMLFFSVALHAQEIEKAVLDSLKQDNLETSQEQQVKDKENADQETSKAVSEEAKDTTDKENYIFVVVEEMPEFPGGLDSMNIFIMKNMNAAAFQKSGYAGQKVVIEMVVEQSGQLSDVAILRSSGIKSFDNEALRVVKTMPPWKPGVMEGMPVRTKKLIPISVTLNK